MPRSKPFSGKAKKAQLQETRSKKRGAVDTTGGSDDAVEGGESGAPPSSIIPSCLLTVSLGKSGSLNRYSTVFAREENDTVLARRIASAEPFRRISPTPAGGTAAERALWLARTPTEDPVLIHPKGVLLQRAMLTGDRNVYLSEDSRAAEERAFTSWLEGIYGRYSREELNYFEHSLDVWAQLWHTLASSDVLCLVADARNPLWHIPMSLYRQITEELKKPLVIILSKADLCPRENVEAWVKYLSTVRCPLATVIPFTSTGCDLSECTRLSERRRAIKGARGKEIDARRSTARAASVRAFLTAAGAPGAAVEEIVSHVQLQRPSDVARRGELEGDGGGELEIAAILC